ncbi:hypothetical protein MD484_g983, partial [Candolleomyces efflorescens]
MLTFSFLGMIYLKTPGQGVLVLGSHQRVVDLLDKRSENYSDRPPLPMIKMVNFDWVFGSMPYGSRWNQHSRAFHEFFSKDGVRKFHPLMYDETKAFLRRVKSRPENLFKDVELLFGMSLMRVAYGFRVAEAGAPGKYLVNCIPALRYVPSWCPGTTFKRVFRELARLSDLTLHAPFEEAKSCLASGENRQYPSMAADLIDNLPEKGDAKYAALEDVARNICAMTYVGGAAPTAIWATAILYVLASYPEVQARAQAEIDAVVGLERLPLVADREKLPYVHAVIKEVGRWHSVGPLSPTHSNIEDDEYDGYFIPKGTIIFSNIWAIMHDPDVFEKPFEFMPERYIKDGKIDQSVPDAEYALFGHGHRTCPGQNFINDSLFLMVAYLLATYTMVAPKDETGKVPPMKVDSSLTATR